MLKYGKLTFNNELVKIYVIMLLYYPRDKVQFLPQVKVITLNGG